MKKDDAIHKDFRKAIKESTVLQRKGKPGAQPGPKRNQFLESLKFELGLSSKEIAFIIGINYRTYQGWESGRKIPWYSLNAIMMLQRMSKADIDDWHYHLKKITLLRLDGSYIGTL